MTEHRTKTETDWRVTFPTEVGGVKFCETEILGEGQVSAFGQEQTLKLLYFYADPIP
jgi:hypothetical protein